MMEGLWIYRVFACLLLQCVFGTVTSLENITFECPDDWDLMGTHCYNFIDVKLDYEDALDVCSRYGSSLLEVRDEVESRAVADVAKDRFQVDHYWIGNGYSPSAIGERPSANLDNVSCGLWKPNQPSLNTNDDFGIASNFHGRWELRLTSTNLPFVCSTQACPKGSFRCAQGSCINEKWKCDGVPDCADHDDENECPNFSDCFKHYKQNSGTIDTQDFSDNDNCQWIIEGEPGDVLRLEFETLTLDDNVDSVMVYTGSPVLLGSQLVMEIKKDITEKLTLFASNHYFIVVLRSHATDVKAVIKAQWNPDQELARGQVMSLSATEMPQNMFTPYHDAMIVPTTYKREFLITAPEGEIITMTVFNSTFNLMNSQSQDYVEIFNHGFEFYDDINNKGVWISKSNQMSVIVKINNNENRVIRATFKTGCNFEISVPYATFSADSLPGNIMCNWTVENQLGTLFSFYITATFYDLEDSLTVFNGTDLVESAAVFTLNRTNGPEYQLLNLYNGISFQYMSNIVQPQNSFQGSVSAYCPPIPDTSKMNITIHREKKPSLDYTISISCEEGYSFSQEEYYNTQVLIGSCNKGGNWDWGSSAYTRFPVCQVVYCGVPPPIENGFIENIGGNVTYQGNATYRCADGFTLQWKQSVTCQADGTWTATPTCEAEECSPLAAVPNGFYNVTAENASNPSAGTVITFDCDAGFLLKGPKQIVCLPHKDWSENPPSCERLFCPFLKIQNGVYETSKPSKEPPLFEESVTLKCNDGYVINRTQTPEDNNIICRDDGQYNATDDVCVDLNECDTGKHNCSNTQECFNVEGSFVCVCKRGYFGSDCTEMNNTNVCEHLPCSDCGTNYDCDCFDGYSLYIANGTERYFLPEGEDGTRAGDVYHIEYSCVPRECTDVPDAPDNGTVLTTRSSLHFDETVDFICDFGFKLSGPASSSCNMNGVFDVLTPPPTCIRQTCSVSSIDEHYLEVSRIPSSGDIEPGDSLIIQCLLNDGSGKITNRTLYCAQDPDDHESFILQGDSPKCPEVDCGEPLNIPGAKHGNVSNTTYASSFEFGCDKARGFMADGESLGGSMTVTCESNGRWGYGNLTCEGPRCGDPGTIAGTIQIVETSYEIDQKVHYNCTQEGFKPIPEATIVCEYVTGKAQWSSGPPHCIDEQKPNLICPENQELNLYDAIVYELPQVSDNSGYSCLTLESGPPSGISVISQALNILYKAKDRELENTCTFNITLSDRTGPEIQCPSDKVVDVVFGSSTMVNITEDMLVSSSGDGMVTINNEGMVPVMAGDVIPIRFNITKENGLSKGCAFLLTSVSTTCKNESLTLPENGKIVCDSDTSCNVSCDSGYVFQDLTETMSYTCQNGTWTPSQSVKPCVRLLATTFEYNIDIVYETKEIFVLTSNNFDDITLQKPHKCLNSHYEEISTKAATLSECGLSTVAVKSFNGVLYSSKSILVSFVLTVSTGNGNITTLQECAKTLRENSETLFGPTNPTTNTTGKTCLPPWTVRKDLNDTKFDAGNEFACDTLAEVVDIKGVKKCLPCGPGTYYDSGTETCKVCENGSYQDMEGQNSCKKCPKFVNDSSLPRTREEDCFATCPEGFESATGYLKDGCTNCPEDTYNTGSTINCIACPDGGSTKGISGAYSASQCSAPCQPGEYSITGYMPCNQCPKHFYSDTTNATICLECPSTKYTNSTGSASQASCLSDDSPCMNFCHSEGTNNASCEIKDHRPVCSCVPGYHGDKCNNKCDLCQPDPCYNGGICESDGTNFTCKCPSERQCEYVTDGFIQATTDGQYLELTTLVKNQSECEKACDASTTCKGYSIDENSICFLYKELLLSSVAATSSVTSGRKNCTVTRLFEGDLCEIDVTNDCTTDVCSQEDFCRDLVNGTQCVCPQGEGYDEKCRKSDNLCSNNPCKNGAQCVSYGSVRYICECMAGFTGSNCEINIDDCKDNPSGCLYGGNCTDGMNMYSCSCGNGFSGDHCEVIEDLCAQNSCGDGGICYTDYKHFTANCSCGANYMQDPDSSNSCVAIKYCDSQPCKNGATCSDYIGGFTCQCPTGYEGSLCQHNIDDCASNPCQNGATCHDGIDAFSCKCLLGYSGDICEVDIDDCIVCDNGGTCEDKFNDYICHCPMEYTGKNCSEDYNECEQIKPCLHGGICNNTMGGYNCMCPDGWTGTNCEVVMDFCSENNLCENLATCYNLHNGTYCQCEPGTAGELCGRKEDICNDFAGQICLNGDCALEGGSAVCKCDGKKEPVCEFIEDPFLFQTTERDFVYQISGNSKENCEKNCDANTDCVAYLIEESGQITICYEYRKLKKDKQLPSNVKAYVKNCTVEEYYTGKSCELERNHCAEDICNSGVCKLDGLQYECNCDNVNNYEGEKCDELKDVCSTITCPATVSCDTYIDSNGLNIPVCKCSATQIFAGNECKEVDTEFDLAFLEDPTFRNATVTSERGFFFERNSDISVAMWVVASGTLDDSHPVLALSSSQAVNDSFLSIFNERVRFGQESNRTDFDFSSLDKDNKWHFISVSWRADGHYQIVYDVNILKDFNDPQSPAVFPSTDMYVFVNLGRRFQGFISQVRVWNSTLTSMDSLSMSANRAHIAKKTSLLLGWTYYTYNDMVRSTKQSTAARGVFICDIDNTIATSLCDSNSGSTDKTPPFVSSCQPSDRIDPGESHQVSIKDKYRFERDSGNTREKMIFPDQTLSFGAFDTAVALQDDAGNIGICMTRIYVTPNKCGAETAPASCLESKNICHAGLAPSVPTPGIIVCGSLLSYNLDNMYEKPDEIVCGDVKERDTKVYGNVTYKVFPECRGSTTTDALSDKIETLIIDYCKRWISPNNTACSNVTVTGVCENSNVKLSLEISGFSEILSLNSSPYLKLTPLELIQLAFANKDELDASDVALAELLTATVMITAELSCECGYALSEEKCVQCGPGSYYDETTKTCKLCELNTYSDKPGQKSCTPCGSNNVTLQRGSSDISDCKKRCMKGELLNKTEECEPCHKNFYQNQEGKDYCFPCPVSYGTETIGATAIEQCFEFCPPGTQLNGTVCVGCPRGFYRDGVNQDQCQACLNANETTRDVNSTSASDCTIPLCPSGNFVNESRSMPFCQLCEHGTYQPEMAQFDCLICDGNFTTVDTGSVNKSQCVFSCPAGHEEYPPDAKTCRPCLQGFYRSDDFDERFENCTMCPASFTTRMPGAVGKNDCNVPICKAGTYLNTTDYKCMKCPLNTYQDMEEAEDCKPCPAGFKTQQEESVREDDCQFVCPPGKEAIMMECENCTRGSYKDETMEFEMCRNCTNSKTTDSEGANSFAMCNIEKCAAGFTVSVNMSCTECPLDTYQPDNLPTTSSVCKECGPGKGTMETASTSEADCKITCQAGYGLAGDMCEICKQGFWNNGNLTMRFEECQQCPETYTTEVLEGATDIANCSLRDCPPGKFIDSANNDACTECPVGSYQPESRQTECLLCPSNTNTSQPGQTNETDCRIYCPAGTQGEDNICLQCPNDTFKARADFGSCIKCTGDNTSTPADRTSCQEVFCDKGREYVNGTCRNCAVGFYKSIRGNTQCEPCPANKTTAMEASVDAAGCTLTFCESGLYSKDNITCEPCAIGTYKSERGNQECSNCDDPTLTTETVGSENATACFLKICPKGQFRNQSNECQACEIGQYQDELGQTQCKECNDGYTTETTGSVNENDCKVNCSVGSFRNNTTNTCFGCPLGSYQEMPGQTSCEDCPANFTTHSENSTMETDCIISCVKGYYRKDRQNCAPCEKGTYQNETDQDSCRLCPRISNHESTTNQTASTKEVECLPICSLGFYLVVSERTCAKCDYGFYKDVESTQDTLDIGCKQCSSDTTTNIEGATSSLDCKFPKCSRGEFRRKDSLECEKCPKGTYQDMDNVGNVTSCSNCKIETTTFIEGATSEDYCRTRCDAGKEYNFATNSCIACEVGQFKNSTMEACSFCPDGQTSLSSGASSCASTTISPEPIETITVQVTVQVTVGRCDNIPHIRSTILRVVLIILQNHRQEKYNGLCPSPLCSNVQIDVENICGSRKKRQTENSGTAKVNVIVSNVDSRLPLNNDPGLIRDSRRAVEEAFYDQTPVEQTLEDNFLTISSAQIGCPPGETLDASSNCVRCKSGQHTVTDGTDTRCEDCPKNTYSTEPVSGSCIPCPDDKVTEQTGSSQKSDCIVRENDSNLTLVAGIAGGVGGLLLLVLIIVGCCAFIRRRNSKSSNSKSLVSETEFMDYKQPFYNQGVMIADPTMFQGETLDLYDQDPSMYSRENAATSHDVNGERKGGSRSRQRERDWW